MRELAPGVSQLSGRPKNGINVYLVEDVLIDAATRRAPKRILGQLQGRKVSAHALTHAHPDHQGASTAVIRMGVGESVRAPTPIRITRERRPRCATRLGFRTGWGRRTCRSPRTWTRCAPARRPIRSTG